MEIAAGHRLSPNLAITQLARTHTYSGCIRNIYKHAFAPSDCLVESSAVK